MKGPNIEWHVTDRSARIIVHRRGGGSRDSRHSLRADKKIARRQYRARVRQAMNMIRLGRDDYEKFLFPKYVVSWRDLD